MVTTSNDSEAGSTASTGGNRDLRWRPTRSHLQTAVRELVASATLQRQVIEGLGGVFPDSTSQRLSAQQIMDVDLEELRKDERLWAAYRRGWYEHACAITADLPTNDQRARAGPIRQPTARVALRQATAPVGQSRTAQQPTPQQRPPQQWPPQQ